MITSWIGRTVGGLRDRLSNGIGSLGIHPNTLTCLGFILNVVAGYLFSTGRMFLAGLVMFFASAFDMIDGAVARITGRQSDFGAFFDSVMDRYSDLALFVGLTVFYARIHNGLGLLATSLALAGSIMISYCRARAESVIPKCKVGFWERPERLVLLMLGAFFNRVFAAVAILAVFTHLTVIHRILYTFLESRSLDAKGKPAGRAKDRSEA